MKIAGPRRDTGCSHRRRWVSYIMYDLRLNGYTCYRKFTQKQILQETGLVSGCTKARSSISNAVERVGILEKPMSLGLQLHTTVQAGQSLPEQHIIKIHHGFNTNTSLEPEVEFQ